MFTLRDLLWMYDGCHEGKWAHTSALLAMLANVNRDPKKQGPFSPADFNPFRVSKRRNQIAKKQAFSVLKAVFVDNERSR